MERCTIRLKTGEARCSQLDGNVVVERLAAYEDTGLTPEEIKAPFTEDTMINLAAQALGVEPSRLRELAEADKDGRLVMLPCKVGDTVYFALLGRIIEKQVFRIVSF